MTQYNVEATDYPALAGFALARALTPKGEEFTAHSDIPQHQQKFVEAAESIIRYVRNESGASTTAAVCSECHQPIIYVGSSAKPNGCLMAYDCDGEYIVMPKATKK